MNDKIENWIEQASKSVTEKSRKEWPTCELNHKKLRFTKGRKYYKLLIESLCGHHTSVYCFIDMEGNLYKAAGYSKPAKGTRGNINTKEANTVQPSTGWLYRG